MRSASQGSRNRPEGVGWELGKLHSPSVNFSFLDFVSAAIGAGSLGGRRQYFIRCFFIFCHVHGVIHTFVFCYFDYDRTKTTLILQLLSTASYLYTSVHTHLIYLWRLRVGRLETRNVRLDRPTLFGLVFILCLYVGIVYTILYEIQQSAYPIPKISYVLGEASFFLSQLLNTIIFFEIAFRVNAEADFIRNLVNRGYCCGKDCRRVASCCTRLSVTFDFALNMLHLEYFISLMFLIPARAARLGASDVLLWDWLTLPRQFLEFMIVVRSGHRVLTHRRRMRRLLKKTPDFVAPNVCETQTFAKEDCGITFALGNSLSYKSFWDFISICWGFSLIVLQIGIEAARAK